MKTRILFLGKLDRAMMSTIEILLSNRIQVLILSSNNSSLTDLPSLVQRTDLTLVKEYEIGKIDFVLVNSKSKISEQERSLIFNNQFLPFWKQVKKVFVLGCLYEKKNSSYVVRLETVSAKIIHFKASLFFENLLDKAQLNFVRMSNLVNHRIYWASAKDFGRLLVKSIEKDKIENCTFYVQGIESLNLNEFITKLRSYSSLYQSKSLLLLQLINSFKWISLILLLSKVIFYEKDEEFKAETTWQTLGNPVIGLDGFLRTLA